MTNSFPVSSKLRERFKNLNIPFKANDNIAMHLSDIDKDQYLHEVEQAAQQFLNTLLIDTENDHNTKETAKRMAKYYVNEIFSGRYIDPPSITVFPNAGSLDEIYTVGPISVRSMCSHHFAPIVGECWIGVYPGAVVSGLSKFHRIVDWIASRPQIQEEMTIQIADHIENAVKPEGLAVLVKANHMCTTLRGVKEHHSVMTTSVVRGCLRNPNMKAEFLSMISK